MWVEELFLEHVQILERLQFVQLKECYEMGMEKTTAKKKIEKNRNNLEECSTHLLLQRPLHSHSL